MSRHEREFFTEKQEHKPAMFTCPKCRHRAEYQVRWIRRVKKDRPPQGSDAQDREMHRKLRDYMVRVDDMLFCQQCRRRFEIPSQQSVVFLDRDTGNQDTGNQDTGNQDTGNRDTGNRDTGNRDTGNRDTGNRDPRRAAGRRRQPRGRSTGWV
ncbi:MAG: hypothetical protein IH939_06870 [Acidobacteria bacterium]|nr:hypothetical protein [Acidobacteriota bacterium]